MSTVQLKTYCFFGPRTRKTLGPSDTQQGKYKTSCTDSNTAGETGRYLIASPNTTLHPFQVSKRGWGVREGRGSVGNANQRLTVNIPNTKRIKIYQSQRRKMLDKKGRGRDFRRACR